METVDRCPQCGGTLKSYLIGLMKDKWMKCEHCGFKMDVPDEAEVVRMEEFVDPEGNLRKVTTVKRRSDFDPKTGGLTKTSVTEENEGNAGYQERVISGDELNRMMQGGELHFGTDEDRQRIMNMLGPNVSVLVRKTEITTNPNSAAGNLNPAGRSPYPVTKDSYAKEKRLQHEHDVDKQIELVKFFVVVGLLILLFAVYGDRILHILGF